MKAVLVIDMPNNCEECKIIYLQGHGESSICDSGDWLKRPSWCPLRPLPSKYSPMDGLVANCEPLTNAYNEGWNDCLDKIMGEMK